MIQAIFFDLWNTLFSNKSYSVRRITQFYNFLQERQIFLSFEQFEEAFHSNFHFTEVTFEEIEFRHIYTEERILSVLESIDIKQTSLEVEKLRDILESEMLQDPPKLKIGVEKTLESLSPDYHIGLISNTGVTPGKIISKVLEEYNILHYFDITVYSDETGLFKPHPKMFEMPLAKFNYKPQNTIHIGDGLETDIKGANDMKINSVWINDRNSPNSSDILPDYEISQISEVIQIIRDLS
ncbi:MAG: HAD family hydrolase [Promethearchaeota archaeon]|jgi:putative hydrolase of the HAD superfamily